MDLAGAFAGRTVFLTGHTGFKGSWLALWLKHLGARVVGYALPAEEPSLYRQAQLDELVESHVGDIRDAERIRDTLAQARPEFVFHLAAQPIVRASYADPLGTFAVNALGAAALLEAVRATPSVRVCVIVTSDKCYAEPDAAEPRREEDRLGGKDPYSASKACAEIVVGAYRSSFFSAPGAAAVASARAGNVIGGGDWAPDRIMPDCVRALAAGRPVPLRNPGAVRPWQHVLDPISGYLRLAALMREDPRGFSEAWNFGPDARPQATVGELATMAARLWGAGEVAERPEPGSPYEAPALRLDSAKARRRLGWRPLLPFETAVRWTVEWYRQAATRADFDARGASIDQIQAYGSATEPVWA